MKSFEVGKLLSRDRSNFDRSPKNHRNYIIYQRSIYIVGEKEIMSLKEWVYKKTPKWLFPLFGIPYWVVHPWRDPVREAAVYAERNHLFETSDFREVTLPFGGKIRGRGLLWAVVGKKYEPGTTNLLLREIEKEMTFVDVGASIGYFTILGAQKVGQEGEVFAFEPSPEKFSILEDNIEINGFKNITAKNFALSDKEGILELSDRQTCGNGFVEIEQKRLDNFLGDVKEPLISKIDVEGMELNVLHGMEGLFEEEVVKGIVFEFNPEHQLNYGKDPESILTFLLDRGFTLHSINRESGETMPVSKEEILENKLGYSASRNLFAKKKKI